MWVQRSPSRRMTKLTAGVGIWGIAAIAVGMWWWLGR